MSSDGLIKIVRAGNKRPEAVDRLRAARLIEEGQAVRAGAMTETAATKPPENAMIKGGSRKTTSRKKSKK